MQPLVEVVRAPFADDLHEAVVVLAAALRARAVPGGERGRLVEEEEPRVAARRHRIGAVAAAELEPARDPALHLERPADAALRVVQAAAVAVHEPALRRGDELAERRHPVLERHGIERTILPSCSPASSRSCAARISSSGNDLVDDRARAAARDELVRALEVLAVPIVEPRMVSCFHQTRWSAAGGFGPVVAPQTAMRPSRAATSSDVLHVASPTCSTTTSAPRPPVASLHGRLHVPGRVIDAASAPSSRARSSFASLEEVTIDRAPSAFAIASAGGRDAAADAPQQHPLALAQAARA